MAYINVSADNYNATLQISTASITTTSSGYIVPALQSIEISNQVGSFQWQQLDEFAIKTVPTPANNSITGNLVLDPTTYFTTQAGVPGLFDLSNEATKMYFRVYLDGRRVGSRYISGSGYIGNLNPSVTPEAPVWVSGFTINVDGSIETGTVS